MIDWSLAFSALGTLSGVLSVAYYFWAHFTMRPAEKRAEYLANAERVEGRLTHELETTRNSFEEMKTRMQELEYALLKIERDYAEQTTKKIIIQAENDRLREEHQSLASRLDQEMERTSSLRSQIARLEVRAIFSDRQKEEMFLRYGVKQGLE